jgi:hypothetical protein
VGTFKVGRPSQQVRLRNWPAGRAAEFRLMATRLERGLADTMGARVKQRATRKLSDNVPIIIEFNVNPGFRQFQLNFPPPPGLGGAGRGVAPHPDRQLLFYEIQHDARPWFPDPTTIETPQNDIILSGAGLSETRYFRARVVSTKFHVSLWTPTEAATTAAGSMIVTPIRDTQTRLTSSFDTWRTIQTRTYLTTGGAVTVTAHISAGAIQEDVTQAKAANGLGLFRSGPAMVQFRWLIDVGDGGGDRNWGDRTLLSARPGYTGTLIMGTRSGDETKYLGKAPLAFGTFMAPWSRPGTSRTIKIQLQAKKLPGSKWKGGEGSDAMRESDPMIFFRNGRVIEILEEF